MTHAAPRELGVRTGSCRVPPGLLFFPSRLSLLTVISLRSTGYRISGALGRAAEGPLRGLKGPASTQGRINRWTHQRRPISPAASTP